MISLVVDIFQNVPVTLFSLLGICRTTPKSRTKTGSGGSGDGVRQEGKERNTIGERERVGSDFNESLSNIVPVIRITAAIGGKGDRGPYISDVCTEGDGC